jgi:hypothetical protein
MWTIRSKQYGTCPSLASLVRTFVSRNFTCFFIARRSSLSFYSRRSASGRLSWDRCDTVCYVWSAYAVSTAGKE